MPTNKRVSLGVNLYRMLEGVEIHYGTLDRNARLKAVFDACEDAAQVSYRAGAAMKNLDDDDPMRAQLQDIKTPPGGSLAFAALKGQSEAFETFSVTDEQLDAITAQPVELRARLEAIVTSETFLTGIVL